MNTATDTMTASTLRERGWTDHDINKFMPKPCATKPNPHYRRAAPMRLYKTKRVFNIEQSAAFQDHTKNRANRKAAAAKGVETKRKKTAKKARCLIDNEFRIFNLPSYKKLEKMAIEAQQDRAMSRGNFFGFDDIDDDTKERWVGNLVRHEYSNYDGILWEIKGLVGTGDAYDKIRASVDKKVDAAIEATKQPVIM